MCSCLLIARFSRPPTQVAFYGHSEQHWASTGESASVTSFDTNFAATQLASVSSAAAGITEARNAEAGSPSTCRISARKIDR